jgi:hypothetical protein
MESCCISLPTRLLSCTQNIHGTLKPLPAFAQRQTPSGDTPDDQAAAEATLPGASGPFLVAWDLQADQGMAQVLLRARAAHCLQRLHVLDTSRQPVAGSDEWQVSREVRGWKSKPDVGQK